MKKLAMIILTSMCLSCVNQSDIELEEKGPEKDKKEEVTQVPETTITPDLSDTPEVTELTVETIEVDPVCETKVIDFDMDSRGDMFESGQELKGQYLDNGVTFSLPSGSPRIAAQDIDPLDAVPVSAPFVLGGNPSTGIEKLDIDFSANASGISFHIIDADAFEGIVKFYDVSGDVIDTQVIEVLSTGDSQLIESEIEGVRRVEIDSVDGVFIDDLIYDICL